MSNTDETPKDSKALDIFKKLSTIPSYTSASIAASTSKPGMLTVHLTQSQRDTTRSTKRNVARALFASVDASGEVSCLGHGLPVDLGEAGRQRLSPSGRLLAVLRAVSEAGAKQKKKFVEVWSEGILRRVLEVTDKHGDFYSDDTFGCLSWAKDESKLIYVAEAKPEEDPKKKFEYVPDWGERFSKKASPRLVLVDLNTHEKDQQILVLPALQGISPGQAFFGPNGESLLFTGYQIEPRRYGIVYCQNRRTGIYQVNLDGSNLVRLNSEEVNGRSPQLSPSEKHLVYVSNKIGGPHASCATLYKYEFSSGANQIVVDQIASTKEAHEFPGLYIDQLPTDCFALSADKASEWVVAHSVWRSRKTLVAINTSTGNVKELTSGTLAKGSYSLLYVSNDYLVASWSTPTEPNSLLLGIITQLGSNQIEVSWKTIEQVSLGDEVKELLNSLTYSMVQNIPSQPEHLEAILLAPKHVEQPPLIVLPHGGPHSTVLEEFALTIAGLGALGFAIAKVNYTGSLGFGQKCVEDLVGKIGEVEVQETHAVVEYLVKQGRVDGAKACAFGGSHGGFTSAHLTARYPDYYKACVLRNPVINVGAMVSTTDIPDWNFAEPGFDFRLEAPTPAASPEQYAQMYACSPIKGVDRVQTPTLVMLGEGDRRVPPTEGISWYNALKTRGVKVRILMFPDTGHALDTVDAEMHGFDAYANFFLEHIGN
ncbi:uncharacterized protein VTP21DRAFT_10914 [Calcarisporiella thermophila]|uniref:uncharacterized protein n=1 Tax=Calcarisporiella thermophila TaxID=911321 RepID=UPI00374227E3